MELKSEFGALLPKNYVKQTYNLLTAQQKVKLDEEFVIKLKERYSNIQKSLSESEIQEIKENIYTQQNFENIQHHLTMGSITIDNIGYDSHLWFQVFLEYLFDLYLIGQIDLTNVVYE